MMLSSADNNKFHVPHRRRLTCSTDSAAKCANKNYFSKKRRRSRQQKTAAKYVVDLEFSAVSTTTTADCNHHQQQHNSVCDKQKYAQQTTTDYCRKRLSSSSTGRDDNKQLVVFQQSHQRCRHSVHASSSLMIAQLCRIKVCNIFPLLLFLLTCQLYYVQHSLCSPSLTSSSTTTTTVTTTTIYPPPHLAGGAALLLLSSPTAGVVPPPHIAALLLQASKTSSAVIPGNLTTKSERLTEAPVAAASATKKVHDFTALQAEVPPDISRQLSNQSMPGQNFNNNNNVGGGGGSINDVCLQAPDYGHCSAKHERFTFNSASRKCQPFIWSGCGGNENRFFSEQQCYDACYGQTGFNPNTHRGIAEQQQQQQNSRQQPNSIPAATNDWERAAAGGGGINSGAGGTLQPQFSGSGGGGGNEYYNSNNNVDVINFSSGGGGGAAAAVPPPPPGSSATAPVAAVAASSATVGGSGSSVGVVKHVDLRCYEPVKRGMCSKYIPRWYFNGTQRDMFYYSGCGPTTENNFATVEDCVSTCAVHKSPGELRQEVCSLEAERGYCGGPSSLTSSTPSTTPSSSSVSPSIAASGIALPQIKWYYNLVEQTCSQFVWSTCEGNSNRFDAKQDCLNLCQGFSKSEKALNNGQPTATANNIVIDNNGRIVLQPPISVHQPNQQQFHAPGVVHQDPLAQHQLPHSSHNFINNLLQQHYSPQSPSPPQNQNNFGAFSPTEHQAHQPPPNVGVSTNTNRPNPSWPISPSLPSSQTTDDYFTNNQHQSTGVGVGVGSGGMLPQPPPLLPTQTPLAPSRPQQNQRQPPPGVGGVGVGVSGGPISQHHPQRQQEYPRLPNTQHLPSECAMPADKGSCLQDIKRWYFDAINLRCRPFYWSGCGGSYNNFISHSECEDRCIVAVAVSNVNNNRTNLAQNNSPGGGPLARPPALPGAPGRSPAVVSSTVVDETSPPPECLLPVERGPCLGETLRYGYDVADNSCKAFMYGCGGNENNFLTENDCLFRCGGGVSGGGGGLQNANQNAALFRPNFMRPRSALEGISNDPSNSADPAAAASPAAGATAAVMPPNNKQQLTALQSQINSICLLPLAEGFCSSKHPRYYYNADNEQCQPFGYTGCGGNENSFPTMNDCIETCSMSTVPMSMHPAASAPATTTTSQHSARAHFFSSSPVPGSPLTQPYDGSSHIGSLADASSGTTAFHDAFWPPSVNQRIIAANNGAAGETAVDFLSSPSVLMDGINILDAPQMLLKKIRTNSAASAAGSGGGGPINSKVQLNYVGGGGGGSARGAAPDRRGTSPPALPPSLAPQPRTSLRTKLQQAAAAASSSAAASNSAGVNKNFLFHNNHYLNDFALIDTMPFLQKRLRSSSSNAAGRPAARRHAYEGQNEAFGGPQAANDNNNNPSEFFSPYNNDAASAPPLPEPQPQHNRFMKARPLQTDLPVPKNYLHASRAKPAKLIVSVTLDPPAEESSADALPKLLVKNSSTNAAMGTKTKLIKKSTKLSTVSAASAAAARHGKTARSTSSLLSEIQSTSTVRTTPVPPNFFRITSRTTNPVTSSVSSSPSVSSAVTLNSPPSTVITKVTPPTPPTITITTTAA